MADYWKSQPRHFCEFCKCWTADNKPSREFHEKGKRHQESVKKKLDDLRKKSVEDEKTKKETCSYIAQMEKAAMKKLKSDLQSNPGLASQYGITFKTEQSGGAMTAPVKVEAPVGKVKVEETAGTQVKVEDTVPGGEWIEGYSPEGYVYYWNTLTQESRWELPTLAATDSTAASSSTECTNHTTATSSTSRTENKIDTVSEQPTLAAGRIKTQAEVVKADVEAESQRKKQEAKRLKAEKKLEKKGAAAAAAVKSEPMILPAPKIEPGRDKPRFQSAYGAWSTVETEEKLVDYELPVDSNYVESPAEIVEPKVVYTAAVVSNEPKLKFAEKTMASAAGLGDGKSEGFKKRKFNSGAQRNIRGEKKLKDDDADS